ncbi:MAG TPA: AAA domain-containing protein [Sphingobium sp.]
MPPVLALGDLPSVATPDHDNTPVGMLAAWTALEALSPQTYRKPEDLASGDRSCVADLSRGQVPWGKGERSRPKRQLYYQVILGAIPMDRATEDLVKAFGADEERSTRQREKAAIGAVMVDKNGVLLEDNSIAVSSFAWALPLALKLKLGALGAWPRIEVRIIEALEKILRRTDDAGNPVPLDLATIDQAHRWLVAQFGIPDHLIEPPSFALRVFHYFKARNPPEVSLLNSFFMGDLSKAADLCAKGELPGGLRQYLGMGAPSRTIDLFSDRAALESAVAPARTPAARWPSPGGHPLVLLQQAAVNLARSALADGGGVIAVNGPPGTGKTTLLRDIVAATVLDRAMAMASFDDPAKAFTPSGERQAFGPKAFFHLYALDPSLKGHEMLVASSNNKAVENVSRELPAAKAVGRSTDDISYFKSVSDLVYSPRASIEDEDGPAVPMEPADTWGLIAAVLGNARNRGAFQQSFWWHEDWGFRTYLKAAKGDPVIQEIRDPETGKIIERRTPPVVLAEQPPSPAFALRNWHKARDRLLALKQTVDGRLAALEAVRILCVRLAETRKAIARDETELAQTRSRRPDIEADCADRQIDVENAARVHGERIAAIAAHRTERPGFFSRVFRTARWAAWTSAQAPLVAAQAQAWTALRAVERASAEADAALAALDQDIAGRETRLAAPRAVATRLASEIDRHRPELGDRIIDEAFFARGHEASNLEAPWISDAVHRLREDLFIAALDVHKAFIDASAQKMLHNLSVLMDVFSGGAPKDPAKKALLGDLWATLFLVVPVISTTFASVERMLGDLPVGGIGWLLVDEAGQALPQAAVGAILRARRAIIVGDPLQIPPVVALPERLNAEICRHFRVDKPVWAAPDASAQTLADRASPYQAAFRSDQGARRVGIPLLVHRRCQEPMFGISNRIAYDGQMVHAPGPRQSAIGRALGPSRWIDVDGEADSKWSPDEGEQIVSLIRQIIDAGVVSPDLFVITPFRIVAQEMRRRLEKERAMFAAAGVDIREWSSDRIGTIHTVQGREAEAVILVLGAPKASQNGARNWAAGTPNILNVAASRAKQHLYVVGSHGAWSGVGHARELAAMPRERS